MADADDSLSLASARVRTMNASSCHFNTPSDGTSSHNLPAQFTSFVGRTREVNEVKQLLLFSRALTLTGMGGVGKTRLALQVATELTYADEFLCDGAIWFV